MRTRYALLLALVLCLMPHTVSACTEYTLITYQVTEWWDGQITILILDMQFYSDCTVSGGGGSDGGGGGGGGGSTSLPPSISIVNVDTTDPYNPIITTDVASNDPDDPVNVINLEINGTTFDWAYWSNTGLARYQFHLPGIGNFPDGTASLITKACCATGVCAQSSANLTRFTPSPITASASIFAVWLEEDEGDEGPIAVTRSAYYGHDLRQLYTRTGFSCSEVGETSHYEIKDSLVTISGNEPMPDWGGTVRATGTIGWWNSWGLADAANPFTCTFPKICTSKAGGVAGAFGYAPSVNETVSPFSIEGQPTSGTNRSLDIVFQ
jgi:hypothetical protein